MARDWLIVALVCLATYRVSRLIVADKVPVVERPRLAVQYWAEDRWESQHPGKENEDAWQSSVAYLLSCMWCTSVWVGGLITLAAALMVGVVAPLLVWATVSAVSGMLGPRED